MMDTINLSVNLYENHVLKDEQWEQLANLAYEAQKLAKYYTDMANTHISRLKEISGDNSCHYGDYLFERIERKGTIDYLAIPGIADLDLEPYRKPSTVAWKLGKK